MKNHKQRWLMWWYQEQGISVILHVLLKYRHVFWNIKFWSTNDGVSFEFATLSINRNNKIIKTYEKCSTTNLMKQLCFSKWILISRIHFPIYGKVEYFKYTIIYPILFFCIAYSNPFWCHGENVKSFSDMVRTRLERKYVPWKWHESL